MKSYLFFALVVILLGCTLGELEGERDLGDGYYLLGYGSRTTISSNNLESRLFTMMC